MTQEDREIIDGLPEIRVAELCNELNCYKVPKEFEKYAKEIEDESKVPVKEYTRGIIHELRVYATSKCSPRLVSRLWNKQMTDEEHNDFWEGHYNGNAEAKEGYVMRNWKEVLKNYPEIECKVDWSQASTGIEKQVEVLHG